MTRSFIDLMNKLEGTLGYQLDSKAYVLENSFIMTVVNFLEFENFTKEIPVFSQEERHRGETRKYLLNAGRLFSNYLSSVCALKDHTRKFMKNVYCDLYGNSNESHAFNGEYGEKIKNEFKEDGLSQFVEDIRNYSQHYQNLPITLLTRIREDEFYARLILDKEMLLQSKWNWVKGEKYLNETKEVDLVEVSTTYMHKNIFPWIMRMQSKEHREEFKELEQLKKIARKLFEEKV